MDSQFFFKRQREAIFADPQRKQLFKDLFELYANSLPMILKGENDEVICFYPDEVEESAEKIKQQIRLRDNQVFRSVINN